MIGPFIPLGKAKPAGDAGRIDNIDANNLRLFAAVRGKTWDFQLLARTAHITAIALVEPFRSYSPLSRLRPASSPSHLKHFARIGLRLRRCGALVHLITLLDAAQVSQAGAR